MSTEPQPNLNLPSPEDSRVKIVVEKLPVEVYRDLVNRAHSFGISLNKYSRAVLEHALEYPKHYEGQMKRGHGNELSFEKINIPVRNSAFKEELKAWGPNGITVYAQIARLVLMKHVEARTW